MDLLDETETRTGIRSSLGCWGSPAADAGHRCYAGCACGSGHRVEGQRLLRFTHRGASPGG